jgi:hypothetical protein
VGLVRLFVRRLGLVGLVAGVVDHALTLGAPGA